MIWVDVFRSHWQGQGVHVLTTLVILLVYCICIGLVLRAAVRALVNLAVPLGFTCHLYSAFVVVP